MISEIVCLKIQHVTYVQLPMLEFIMFVFFVVMPASVVVSI